jgi:hypothetical protein
MIPTETRIRDIVHGNEVNYHGAVKSLHKTIIK